MASPPSWLSVPSSFPILILIGPIPTGDYYKRLPDEAHRDRWSFLDALLPQSMPFKLFTARRTRICHVSTARAMSNFLLDAEIFLIPNRSGPDQGSMMPEQEFPSMHVFLQASYFAIRDHAAYQQILSVPAEAYRFARLG